MNAQQKQSQRKTLKIDADIHSQLQAQAKELGVTMSNYLVVLLNKKDDSSTIATNSDSSTIVEAYKKYVDGYLVMSRDTAEAVSWLQQEFWYKVEAFVGDSSTNKLIMKLMVDELHLATTRRTAKACKERVVAFEDRLVEMLSSFV